MDPSNIILILLYLSPFYRTYYKATIKASASVKRGYYKALHTHLSDNCITFAMSHSVDFTTFKFPIPDYSKGTSISNSTNTWTAPKCGVVIALLVADTAVGYKSVTISVNDKIVASGLWAGATGGYNFQTRAIVPVATGDKVTFSANEGNSKVDQRMFYPYKWVS